MNTLEIFRKEFTGVYNYFAIYIMLPDISINTRAENTYGENEYIFNLSFPTKINFSKDRVSWSFELAICGFGFSIYRQCGF